MEESRDVEIVTEGIDERFIGLVHDIGRIANQLINKPTTIEKVFPVSYKLDKDAVQDLFSTVTQKIQGYRKEDVSFEISVHYNDKTYESFPALERFLNNHETQPKYANSLKLTWSARFFFEDRTDILTKKMGEYHKIEISFMSPPEEAEGADNIFFIFNDSPVEGFGVAHVSIQHSNKVWAVEVIKHIEDFLSRITIKQSGFIKFLFSNRSTLGKLSEKIIQLSPLIPLLFLFYSLEVGKENINKELFKGFIIAGIFFVVSNIVAYSGGRFLYKKLSKLSPKSFIIVNKYSENIYKERSANKGVFLQIALLFILPFLINVFSTWLCLRLGMR